MAFYNLTEAERISQTEEVIRNNGTLRARWENLGSAEANPWSKRSERAGQLLGPVESVLDVGCGTMGLEPLVQTREYIPSDVVARDARTIVRDYNIDGPPSVVAEAAAVLGVLEYLHAPQNFMRDLGAHKAVVSYCVTDAPHPLEPRRAHAWVNDMSSQQVEALLTNAGWVVRHSEFLDSAQMIWLVERV